MKRATGTCIPHVLLLLSLCSATSLSQRIEWKCSYDEAKQEALRRGKLLLLDIVGRWKPLESRLDDPRLRMEQQVWEDSGIVTLANQFVCLRISCGHLSFGDPWESDLLDLMSIHYRITDLPATIIVDPMGSEVARIVGITSRDEMRQVLDVQSSPLYDAYEILKKLEKQPDNVGLQIAAADAYLSAGLPILSRQYYDKARDTDTLKLDAHLREHVDLNSAIDCVRLNNLEEGINLFERQLDRYPASKNRPDYLLWLVKLNLQALQEVKARTWLDIMESEYPDSAQTRSARALFVN